MGLCRRASRTRLHRCCVVGSGSASRVLAVMWSFRSPELAQSVVDAGAVPLLVLCIQEPEISLKRITASALNDIAKHSPEVRRALC